MKISWGLKIGLLYGTFAVGIVTLVIASNRQHFDLVSKDYYEAELGFQKVIDAGKNQAGLSHPISIYADGSSVNFEFPNELKDKALAGNIQFYSPVNAEWDKTIPLHVENNKVAVNRSELKNTRYTVKVSFVVDGKNYYQESELQLTK